MSAPNSSQSKQPTTAWRDHPQWASRLPGYARSLLRIEVPVSVTLAATRQPIREIIELVPGSIIHFDKLCDETLTLEVGDQAVAEGEAVKVGDKFGLRITSMVLPEERFLSVTGRRASSPPSTAAED